MIEELERVSGRAVSRETFERLQGYAAAVHEENARQNLVSRSTLNSFWERHILDSAQLLRFAPPGPASWVDIGSGAGLPGVVIACLTGEPMMLIEPRRLRADFLSRTCESLGLGATVFCGKAERARGTFGVITARAVAPLATMLGFSAHLSTRKTLWLLPKGRNAQSELAEARRAWQGSFRIERSATSEDSFIVVASGVEAKPRR